MRLAIITGGTRGIGRGISEVLASSNEYDGLLLTYNTNQEAAESFRQFLLEKKSGNDDESGSSSNSSSLKLKKVELIAGDLTTIEARNKIFKCVDEEFGTDYDLATVVHNAGQYVGVTSDNAGGIEAGTKKFGDGSLLKEQDDGTSILDTTYMDYYQKLYGTAFIDICERSMARMKKAYEKNKEADGGEDSNLKYRGSIIGISSPGCNASFKVTPGYDMPGSGKCLMEFSIRLYALEAAKYGINCNVIIPGFTKSDAWGKIAEKRGMTKEAFLNHIARSGKIPMQEVIDATDIGDTVKFLAGNGGGRFMTGLSLRVDAGLHLMS
jgi:NAD(P)-dependent dehydrogenase (short-subunit alcohol dehydrogenase family)